MWMCVYMFIMCICEEVFDYAHMQRSQRTTLGMFLCCFCGRGSLAWLDSESWGPTYCLSPPSTMQRCTAIFGFYVGAGDLYLYPHTHTRSTLPLDHPHHPWVALLDWECFRLWTFSFIPYSSDKLQHSLTISGLTSTSNKYCLYHGALWRLGK